MKIKIIELIFGINESSLVLNMTHNGNSIASNRCQPYTFYLGYCENRRNSIENEYGRS